MRGLSLVDRAKLKVRNDGRHRGNCLGDKELGTGRLGGISVLVDA